MATLTIMSLNGQDMIELIPKSLELPGQDSRSFWRATLLAAMVHAVSPDILGLVEAPPAQDRTEAFVTGFLGGGYRTYFAERRGTLGMALLVRDGVGCHVTMRSKAQSYKDFRLAEFDADGDGIKELYSWWNRVPLEAELSGGGLTAPVTFILVHAKSKGAFLPGDLFAYEKLSQANRMKQRAQAHAIRQRLDRLIDHEGRGRVIVMGDMNDGPEFDQYAAILGGGFLEPLMGSIWQPSRIMHNPHYLVKPGDRWTIDFKDRVINPLTESKYGQPTELRSWIDHILVSPVLRDCVVPGSARILHKQPSVPGLPRRHRRMRGTDHHPPSVALEL